MELKNRVAIITGASGGIGRSIALELANAGVRMMLVGRSRQKLETVAQEAASKGALIAWRSIDIRDATAVEHMVNETLEYFGQIDILVNSAFWGPPASLEDTTEDFWDQTLDTTLKAAFLCTRAVVPQMKRQGYGRIVNIGSRAGKVGEDNRSAYCAAKWGLEGLTAALSEELHRYNIHVHLISPAATNTPWWREVSANLTPEVVEKMIPPEVIAQAVRWVLSLPDQVHVPDLPIYNFQNPFEGKRSPFEGL
ncbi:SDR family oxidoreductase [uncultured Thermanaerothrix sp.]|uniref:SDR family oxidoreductase n=1 Tax=uncultured Thermanaerothrix sp. TaxID=1195149 RepID=UPI002621BC9E|nr:SDR family oxidoreductase [uncultured Thermanaerothrix sp.]